MVAASKPRPHIYLLDDDPLTLRACTRALRDFTVTATLHAEKAVEEIEALEPDAIVMDYNLGKTTGANVIAHLRARGIMTPILLMSGSFDAHRGSEQFSFGANDVLAKPFMREALLAKVERLLSTADLERRAREQNDALRELNERREFEVGVANELLARMLARGQFDPERMRYSVIPNGDFSGDVVLAADLGDGRQRWMVADVTGHTLSSALVTIPLSMIFYATSRKRVPLRETLETFEDELSNLLPVNMYVVATVGELDRTERLLRVFNGGAPPLVIRRTSGALTLAPSENMPLAVRRSSDRRHVYTTFDLVPGDRIYTFTDGLVELRAPNGDLLGFDAVAEALRHPDSFDEVHRRCRDHLGGGTADDDISLLEVTV